jgi:hypothetical protein
VVEPVQLVASLAVVEQLVEIAGLEIVALAEEPLELVA